MIPDWLHLHSRAGHTPQEQLGNTNCTDGGGGWNLGRKEGDSPAFCLPCLSILPLYLSTHHIGSVMVLSRAFIFVNKPKCIRADLARPSPREETQRVNPASHLGKTIELAIVVWVQMSWTPKHESRRTSPALSVCYTGWVSWGSVRVGLVVMMKERWQMTNPATNQAQNQDYKVAPHPTPTLSLNFWNI